MKRGIGKTIGAAVMALAAIPASASEVVLASGDVGQPCCPFSDFSLKNAIQPLEGSTQRLMQLNGVQFSWKDSGREDIGLIAQNVEQVFPQLVYEKEGLLTVDYQKLVAPLIESVRELNARIEKLERAQTK
ncbi:MAG TPA: tail fiber domain-containing protein [Pseudomonas sp.]|uniref:tail fiber domain-containing protein n=1 Tax=Pseudomonas sp. TaxID=306 RepID=UPI002B4A688D|nr:tail fiber domain-containing protein [Pseudomonas sp.]HKS12931.1 tail fiber domain-containing protein [Pseudomonas sp.]